METFIDESEDDNIWVASTNGNVERVNFLIKEGGVPINAQDETGFSPIHAAASYGQLDLLQYLVENGADVHLRDGDGDTPLLVCEDPIVIEALEKAGADINARNQVGEGIKEKVINLLEDQDECESLIEYLIKRGILSPTFKEDQTARILKATGMEMKEEEDD
jgi:ankyrin repeat protein